MLAQVKVAPGPGALLTWSDDLPQQQKPGCGGPGQRWPGSGPMTWPSFLLMENSSWASSPKELDQPTFFGRAVEFEALDPASVSFCAIAPALPIVRR